jgi:hypothetical protein
MVEVKLMHFQSQRTKSRYNHNANTLHVTSMTDIAMSKITHEMYGVRTNHVNDNVVSNYA